MDPRVEKLADIMVNYSLELKKGDWVKVQGIPTAMPLIKAFFKKALEAGAYPYYQAISDELEETFYKFASEEQLKFISEINKIEPEKLDAIFAIMGRENTKYLSGVDPAKMAMAQGARQHLFQRIMERSAAGDLNWVGTMYPTHSAAQDADMSLSDYEEFVYGAGHVEDDDPVAFWKDVSKRQAKQCDYMENFKEIHVKSGNTDLKVKVEGRKWINCDGKYNFPDGEIFTTPLENSAEGHIVYTYPACYGGREVANVRLVFKEGKVVDFSADKNLNYLEKMINMDDGSRYLGEFAIGTNYNITQFTKNILFDEKIGGTIHLALGAAPVETGGTNKSGLHWDMVCDLKDGGELYADGELFYKNGKFLKEF